MGVTINIITVQYFHLVIGDGSDYQHNNSAMLPPSHKSSSTDLSRYSLADENDRNPQNNTLKTYEEISSIG